MLKSYFLSSLVVLACFLFIGISSYAHEGHEDGQHDEQQVAAKEAKVNIIGNIVGEESAKLKIQCPVMKTWFVPDEKTPEKTPKSVYKDKTYYFCCKACKPMFDKDPEKYLKG